MIRGLGQEDVHGDSLQRVIDRVGDDGPLCMHRPIPMLGF